MTRRRRIPRVLADAGSLGIVDAGRRSLRTRQRRVRAPLLHAPEDGSRRSRSGGTRFDILRAHPRGCAETVGGIELEERGERIMHMRTIGKLGIVALVA